MSTHENEVFNEAKKEAEEDEFGPVDLTNVEPDHIIMHECVNSDALREKYAALAATVNQLIKLWKAEEFLFQPKDPIAGAALKSVLAQLRAALEELE